MADGTKEEGKTRNKLRRKLFSREDSSSKSPKSPTQTDEDIMKFLHSSKPASALANPATTLRPLDVANAPRYPGATDGNGVIPSAGSSNTTSGGPRSPALYPSPSPRNTKKNKGLTVKFTKAIPVVIGQGGDESQEPTIEISRYRDQQTPQSASASETPIEPTTAPEEPEEFKPKAFKRQPTGLGQAPGASHHGHSMQDYDSDELESPNDVPNRSPGAAASLSSFAKRVQAKRNEEARALHQPPRPPSPSGETSSHGSRLAPPQEAPPDYFAGSSDSQQLREFQPSPNYSIRPTISRQPSPMGLPQSSHPSNAQNQGPAPPPPPAHAKNPRLHPPLTSHSSNSIHSVVAAVGDQALEDFSQRVEYYFSIFHVSAEDVKPITETPFLEWMRAATWWFLKGRYELEAAMRTRPSSSGPQIPTQSYIDLAKAWWIAQQVTAQHPEPHKYGNAPIAQLGDVARSYGDHDLADCIDIHQAIVSNLRALTMSMKRNNVLPNYQNDNKLDPSLEVSIWIKYPFFTPEVCSVLSSTASKSLVLQAPRSDTAIRDTLPIGDTRKDFNYGRFFADVYLSDNSDTSSEFHLPCVLSVLRDRTDWQVKIVLASQSDLVNIRVNASADSGLSWEDVRWRARQFCLLIELQRNITLTVQLSQRDFRTLWNLYDHSNKIEDSLNPEPGEMLVFETTVNSFQLTDSDSTSKLFPKEPVPRCRVRLFEKKVTLSEGTGDRKAHRGFRILVVSSPRAKVMSRVSEVLGGLVCIQYGLLREADGGAALLLKLGIEPKVKTFTMSFQDEMERAHVFSILNASAPEDVEMFYADLPLKSLGIEPKIRSEAFVQSGHDMFKDLQWERLRVINRDPENPDHDYGQTVLSPYLRIVSEAKAGTVTDRINVGPGQLMVRLEVSNAPEIRIYRSAQEDLTISVAEQEVPKDRAADISSLLKVISKAEAIHNYSFHNLKDLHAFQAAITGFQVLFDG
ncbi:MAG: hypothetical protein M1814_006937 [Vezdaea aestivalis]|nr:MAG: hypothetical protein M1814_006937 [Vezdaea aestivalis]